MSRADKVALLTSRRFPGLSIEELEAVEKAQVNGASLDEAINVLAENEGVPANERDTYSGDLKAALAFKAELSSSTRMRELYGEVRAKEEEEREARGRTADQQRFFNKPSAAADFQEWGRKAYWTVDEAVALCLSKNPSRVNARSLKPWVHVSPFAAQYMQNLDLIGRAAEVGEIGKKPGDVSPKKLFTWAKRNGFPYPSELERTAQQPGAGNKVEENTMGRPEADEIDTRTLHTFYKLVLGLAQKHHGLEFSDEGHRRASKGISDLLHHTPFEVADKTVSKHLKAAADWAISQGKVKTKM